MVSPVGSRRLHIEHSVSAAGNHSLIAMRVSVAPPYIVCCAMRKVNHTPSHQTQSAVDSLVQSSQYGQENPVHVTNNYCN